MVAGVACAQTPNIPSGLTGLWRFQDTNNLGAATVGTDIMFSNAVYGVQYLGPWTDIGGDGWLTRYSEGFVFQEQSWNYLAVNPRFTANGGGGYVNEYTIAIDYKGDPGLNSLFQTAWNGNANDGDLWIDGTTHTNATIGVDDVGFSSLTFDASKWHRIVWSVDNGSFFRVYVDGTLFLDGAGQEIDGRFALFPERFNLFADNSWEDKWGLVGTVATWNRALTGAEIAAMGGWIGGAATPTPLVYTNAPEVVLVSPSDGETNVAPGFAYAATIFDPVQLIDRNSLQLLLDGTPVTPQITGPVASIYVTFSGGGLLPSASTHTYTLIGGSGGLSLTNEVSFTVQNHTSYEWRFTNGDLSASLGNGVMSYADEFSTPGLTSFGTTDGTTVPHINGSPANYMHVPGFTLDTDGYWLQFSDSGPNVGASPNINRYTLLMDVMVPSPWSLTWLVPFFNTDPYNLNDADFYLYGDGSVGIGGPGYSAAGVTMPDTWFRLGFVADLQANTLTYYINGTNVRSGAANGLGGRWALYSNQDVGPLPLYPANLLLFNEGDTGGIYTHDLYVSSVAFVDRVLSAGELAALGGPNANGILVPSFTPAPMLTSQRAGDGVVISWPANYVGYTLEGKTDLAGSTWVPVAGVTNNSLTVPAGSGSQFFRLVQ